MMSNMQMLLFLSMFCQVFGNKVDETAFGCDVLQFWMGQEKIKCLFLFLFLCLSRCQPNKIILSLENYNQRQSNFGLWPNLDM